MMNTSFALGDSIVGSTCDDGREAFNHSSASSFSAFKVRKLQDDFEKKIFAHSELFENISNHVKDSESTSEGSSNNGNIREDGSNLLKRDRTEMIELFESEVRDKDECDKFSYDLNFADESLETEESTKKRSKGEVCVEEEDCAVDFANLPEEWKEQYGDIVWVSTNKTLPWWPSMIYNPSALSNNVRSGSLQHIGKRHVVYHYGSADWDYALPCQIKPFTEENFESFSKQEMTQSHAALFTRGLDLAKEDFKKLKVERALWNHFPSSATHEYVDSGDRGQYSGSQGQSSGSHTPETEPDRNYLSQEDHTQVQVEVNSETNFQQMYTPPRSSLSAVIDVPSHDVSTESSERSERSEEASHNVVTAQQDKGDIKYDVAPSQQLSQDMITLKNSTSQTVSQSSQEIPSQNHSDIDWRNKIRKLMYKEKTVDSGAANVTNLENKRIISDSQGVQNKHASKSTSSVDDVIKLEFREVTSQQQKVTDRKKSLMPREQQQASADIFPGRDWLKAENRTWYDFGLYDSEGERFKTVTVVQKLIIRREIARVTDVGRTKVHVFDKKSKGCHFWFGDVSFRHAGKYTISFRCLNAEECGVRVKPLSISVTVLPTTSSRDVSDVEDDFADTEIGNTIDGTRVEDTPPPSTSTSTSASTSRLKRTHVLLDLQKDTSHKTKKSKNNLSVSPSTASIDKTLRNEKFNKKKYSKNRFAAGEYVSSQTRRDQRLQDFRSGSSTSTQRRLSKEDRDVEKATVLFDNSDKEDDRVKHGRWRVLSTRKREDTDRDFEDEGGATASVTGTPDAKITLKKAVTEVSHQKKVFHPKKGLIKVVGKKSLSLSAERIRYDGDSGSELDHRDDFILQDKEDKSHFAVASSKSLKTSASSSVHVQSGVREKKILTPLRCSDGRYSNFIGKKCQDVIQGKSYRGKVISYKKPFFHIEYDSALSQDLTIFHLKILLEIKQSNPLFYLGQKFEKEFDDGIHKAEVIGYEDPYYTVLYLDNHHREELSLEEIKTLLDPSSFPKLYIGKKIKKEFDDVDGGVKTFEGIVQSYEEPYFVIEYEDGDKEDLSRDEVSRVLRIKKSSHHNKITKVRTGTDHPKEKRVSLKVTKAAAAPAWQIFGRPQKSYFCGSRPGVIELDDVEGSADKSFFKELFSKDRTILLRQKLGGKGSLIERPGLRFEFFDCDWHIISVKIRESSKCFRGINIQSKDVEFYYIAVSGEGINTISLQEELEKVADFSAVQSTRKIASRLELMQSSAISTCPPVNSLTFDDFELIEDEISEITHEYMGDGCGFIPCSMLTALLGGNEDNHLAIQVRVFGPRLGVYKGMLCRKHGITKIQLPPSMLKVGPSLTCDDDWVSLVIIRKNPSTVSLEMEKYLSGGRPSPSFEMKKISEMVKIIWKTLGAPEEAIENHSWDRKNRTKKKIQEHSWLVGLADPTNAFPPDTVFVTGWRHMTELPAFAGGRDKVFVTRSPCVKPEDGRLLTVIKRRPINMQKEKWNWLLTLPFGGLIFSTAGKGVPLPQTCSAGDLDGDLYFVSWDYDIISNITVREIKTAAEQGKKNANSKKTIVRNPNWFAEVQNHLIDDEVLREQLMVSRLYKEMEKIQKTSEKGMDDPDALAYADAYLQALDLGKHGRKIKLKKELRRAAGIPDCYCVDP